MGYGIRWSFNGNFRGLLEPENSKDISQKEKKNNDT